MQSSTRGARYGTLLLTLAALAAIPADAQVNPDAPPPSGLSRQSLDRTHVSSSVAVEMGRLQGSPGGTRSVARPALTHATTSASTSRCGAADA